MRWMLFLMMLLVMLNDLSAQRMPDLIPYTDGVLWGYSNAQGKVIIAPQWTEATPFNGIKARVRLDPYKREYQLIDKKGQYVVPPSRHWNGEWLGFARTPFNATDDAGHVGMIDTNNQLLIPFLYERQYGTFQYSPYWKRYYLVTTINKKYGIIDTLNNVLSPFEYEQLNYVYLPTKIRENIVYLSPKDSLLVLESAYDGTSTYAVTDFDRKILIPYQYEKIAAGFRWKGKVYAFSIPNNQFSGGYNSKLSYQTINEGKITVSAGQTIEALAPYRIIYMAHVDGTSSNEFEGYLYVMDSTRHRELFRLRAMCSTLNSVSAIWKWIHLRIRHLIMYRLFLG